jgi:hypothetical protein
VSLGECWEPPPEGIQDITKIFNKILRGAPYTLRIGSMTAKGLLGSLTLPYPTLAYLRACSRSRCFLRISAGVNPSGALRSISSASFSPAPSD